MRANSFYANPRLSALAVLFIVALGGMAFLGLARQEDPTMTERWAGVNTFLAGATAERMEALVSEPIETALREVPEIREIESTSKAGLSVVGIELYDHIGPDQVDAVWSEVRDKLADVEPFLPANATEPELTIRKPLASTLILSVSWQQDGPNQLNILSRVAEHLRLKLANLPGTEIAESWGAAEEEVLVSVDPYSLSNAGLTTDAVVAAVRAADTKLPSGRVRGDRSDLLVEVDAELNNIERIARIPLIMSDSGDALRVSDVAQVKKVRLDPPNSIAMHGDDRVILVNAKMQPGLQIGNWMSNARAVVNEYKATLPQGIGVEIVYDQAIYTQARMDSLGANLAFALVIVLLVLIWFMGVRSALTVGIALPLSAGMVLIGMQFLSIPLHQMSVTGLIISLGLLIDNAIVVVEDYKLRRRRGHNVADAISAAVRHLLVPLGASTATTVFAFMPIALAPGGVGDFTGTIGMTVALSVVSSFLLAMTVVPAIAGFIERRWPMPVQSQGKHWWQTGYSNDNLTNVYRNTLHTVLRRPWLGVAIGCTLPLIGFLLAPTLTQQFFPPVDRNQFQVQLALPAHASMTQTQEAVRKADAVLRADTRVTDSFWSLGQGAPRVFYNVVSLNERVPSFASAWVNTESAAATQTMLADMQAALSAALPEAEVLAIPFEQGPPTDAPIEMRIVGQDLETLRHQGEKLRQIIAGIDNVTYTRATLSTAEPKLTFEPNENAAARAGVSTGDLARRLNSALTGDVAGTVLEGSSEIQVRVRLSDEYRDNSLDLTTLPILTSQGAGVPLDQLGEWRVLPTATAINRRQGDRLNTIQAYLVPFTLPASVLAEVEAKLAAEGFILPAGYKLEIGGEAEQSSESMGNLVSVFMFFALAMAAVVVLSLNSFRQAGLIGFVAILSFGLALFGVRLFGYPFGYMALIGSLGMMGLAINGAIIVLSALKASEEALAGDRVATVEVVINATRHIISTTVTTIGGFVPLIVAGGTFWPPLATAIAGGIAGSAMIALFMVPTLFHRSTRRDQLESVAPAVSQPARSPIADYQLADYQLAETYDRRAS